MGVRRETKGSAAPAQINTKQTGSLKARSDCGMQVNSRQPFCEDAQPLTNFIRCRGRYDGLSLIDAVK